MKPKNNLFKTLLGIVGCMLMAVTFNAAAGATCAVAIGCAPEAGAIAGNVLALALQGAAPSGALRAGVLKEYGPANRSNNSAPLWSPGAGWRAYAAITSMWITM